MRWRLREIEMAFERRSGEEGGENERENLDREEEKSSSEIPLVLLLHDHHHLTTRRRFLSSISTKAS